MFIDPYNNNEERIICQYSLTIYNYRIPPVIIQYKPDLLSHSDVSIG